MKPKIFYAGYHQPGLSWKVKRHYHDYHELCAIVKGQMSVNINNQAVNARAGEVLFYPAGFKHKERNNPQDPVAFYIVCFQNKLNFSDLPYKSKDLKGRIRLLLIWLNDEKNSTLECSLETQKSFLTSLLLELYRVNNVVEGSLAVKVKDFMRAHIAEPLTLDILAEQVNTSKFYFSRQYKKLTGRTPMEDLRYMRVLYARDLIITSKLPLKAVAPQAGLGDEYKLSRLFRKYLGITPGSIRKYI